jgi:adenine-specific DNA-methyltransferase
MMKENSLTADRNIIAQLKEIVPEAFPNGKLDIDQLRSLLGEGSAPSTERYQLSWPGKSEAYKTLQTKVSETLQPNFRDSINWDIAENIFIEGENLAALKVLHTSYHGKVKLVLIDPPYNTGSNNFIYQDKFAESKNEYLKRIGGKGDEKHKGNGALFSFNENENGQFHSNWLSMMLPRLFMGRNLLREDGAMLVHIDEHEQANLTLLLNEVFGEHNQLGNVVWDKGNPKGDAGGIAYQHESILIYAKNKEKFLESTKLVRKKKNAERMLKKAGELFKQLDREDIPGDLKKLQRQYELPLEIVSKLTRKFTLEEINRQYGVWLKKQDLTGGERTYNKIDADGNVYRLVSMAWPNKRTPPDDYFVPLIHPVTNKACPVPQRGWRFPTSTIQGLLKKGEIIFGTDESVQPQRKYLLKNNLYENLSSVLFYGGSDDELLRNLEITFENPKPLEFTKTLVQSLTGVDSCDIVLDFFAGSGTTAHAVLEANKEDSGNRRFIMIQLPEAIDEKSAMFEKGYRSIAELTSKRIRSVIEEVNGDRLHSSDLPVGIRCYRLACDKRI